MIVADNKQSQAMLAGSHTVGFLAGDEVAFAGHQVFCNTPSDNLPRTVQYEQHMRAAVSVLFHPTVWRKLNDVCAEPLTIMQKRGTARVRHVHFCRNFGVQACIRQFLL